jgi:hypothetical protein
MNGIIQKARQYGTHYQYLEKAVSGCPPPTTLSSKGVTKVILCYSCWSLRNKHDLFIFIVLHPTVNKKAEVREGRQLPPWVHIPVSPADPVDRAGIVQAVSEELPSTLSPQKATGNSVQRPEALL